MEISSTAAAVAAKQSRVREDFTMKAMKQEAETQASMAAELEKAAQSANTTETRGRNVNIVA